MNDIRISKIDNGFVLRYWNGAQHEVFCATIEEVVPAIQTALATKVVDNGPQVDISSSNTTQGTVTNG